MATAHCLWRIEAIKKARRAAVLKHFHQFFGFLGTHVPDVSGATSDYLFWKDELPGFT